MSATDTPGSPLPAQVPPRPHRFLGWFDTSFRNIWFYVAAGALVVNLCYTYRPQLQIQAVSLGDGNPLESLFTFSNPGAWPLHDVRIACELYDHGHAAAFLQGNAFQVNPDAARTGNPDILVLEQNRPATRDCGIAEASKSIKLDDLDLSTIRLKLMVDYRWMFGLMRGGAVFLFNTRSTGGTKFVLVPDVEEVDYGLFGATPVKRSP